MFYSLVVLVPWFPVCHIVSTFFHRRFPSTPSPSRMPSVGLIFTPPAAPPPHIALDTTHGECAAKPIQLCLLLAPPHREQFGCFEDPPGSRRRLLCCSGPQCGLNFKHQGGKCRWPFGSSEPPMLYIGMFFTWSLLHSRYIIRTLLAKVVFPLLQHSEFVPL